MRNGRGVALGAALLCGLPFPGEAQDRSAIMTRELNAVINMAVAGTHFMGTVLVASGARRRYARNIGMAYAA